MHTYVGEIVTCLCVTKLCDRAARNKIVCDIFGLPDFSKTRLPLYRHWQVLSQGNYRNCPQVFPADHNMVVLQRNAAKAVPLEGFKRCLALFPAAHLPLCDIPTCCMACQKWFCMTRAILSRRFQKMGCVCAARAPFGLDASARPSCILRDTHFCPWALLSLLTSGPIKRNIIPGHLY